MKKLNTILLGVCIVMSLMSCNKDMDDEFIPASNLEIQDFIYSAMNIWYLYKPNVPDLANGRFASNDEYANYLASFDTPESLFYDGLVADIDRFSFITADYRELENSFAGVTLNNGMDFGLFLAPNDPTSVFGAVRYVLPNTSADEEGVMRGMLFNTIDGEPLSANGNRLDARSRELLNQNTYTIGLATLNQEGDLISTEEEITLVKEEYTENPILISETLNIEDIAIGYLMYNAFTSDFDDELNQAFGEFEANGVTELVLDLRYNGGGSVRTATDLGSMITGQFEGEIFSTERWNPEIQEQLEENDPESLENRFNASIRTGEAINSLGLSRVVIITTGSTASASELVINSLNPYIEVVTVGETTTGKFQASTTFYDSEAPNFRRNGASQNHFYAIQPLIFTSENVNGVGDFVNGIDPDEENIIEEDVSNLGVLGDPDERLLDAALNVIVPSRSPIEAAQFSSKPVGERLMFSPTYQRMYVKLE